VLAELGERVAAGEIAGIYAGIRRPWADPAAHGEPVDVDHDRD
jgi:hypothetical protein